MATAAQSANVARRLELENNAEYQRNKLRTPTERKLVAIERSAKDIKSLNDYATGSETSYDEARKKAETFAHKTEGDKNEG
jgi:hypothetical protein